MNEIKVKVNFQKRQCFVNGFCLTTGDYNSTKIIFTFDRLDGKKIFEMKNPSEEIVFAQEIKNNEIILVGQTDVIVEHDDKEYIKYLDSSENIYWYNSEEQKLYDSNWDEISNYDLNNYTKQTENASIFTEKGKYIFEISLYDGDSKLTSASNYLLIEQEEVVIDDKVVTPYSPIFDELIKETNKAIDEANNLDIDIVKEEDNTVVEITRKDGSKKSAIVSSDSGSGLVDDVKVDGKSVVDENKVANIDLTGKVDKVTGKGLSTNDYTKEDKDKLANIESGAEVNKVNSVNNQTGDVKIDVPTKTSDLTNDKGYITKAVSNLTNYYNKTYIDETIGDIESLLGGI